MDLVLLGVAYKLLEPDLINRKHDINIYSIFRCYHLLCCPEVCPDCPSSECWSNSCRVYPTTPHYLGVITLGSSEHGPSKCLLTWHLVHVSAFNRKILCSSSSFDPNLSHPPNNPLTWWAFTFAFTGSPSNMAVMRFKVGLSRFIACISNTVLLMCLKPSLSRWCHRWEWRFVIVNGRIWQFECPY
jgi:hypothetical protein